MDTPVEQVVELGAAASVRSGCRGLAAIGYLARTCFSHTIKTIGIENAKNTHSPFVQNQSA